MGSKILNGTTVTQGGVTVNKIKSLNQKDGAKWIDITGLSDTGHVFELGKSDVEIQVVVVGASAITHGAKNYLIINHALGNNTNTTNMIASVDGPNGALDGECTTTITFKQGEA